ncbi:protein-glutamine gamma-glutamyltransferase 2 [Anguilla anguilla]|uniref:protein-glutamine gamma-glutamyltransferase 2 n=1 Tax=Anguilla anguilla TaxID=7936 RepID=UPI0015ACDACE|nr:protein-glutamine gamma-glutamyltransferase 2 [Anguilla anguilla]
MAQALDIGRWDLECEFNNTDHRTELNGVDRLIVRRGQPFTISLHLRSGTFEPRANAFTLIAETGPCSSEGTGTRAAFGLSGSVDETRWSAAASCPDGRTVSLSVCSPPDAPIGRYSLTLDQGHAVSLGEFVLLFNPWCPRDVVYMDSEEKLREYVLSQDGIIFRGSYKYPMGTPWNFGQFEYGILDACLRILDVNPKYMRSPDEDCSGRRNPIYVSRVLSAMVNCNDDRGVLFGRWTEDYEDGVSPLSWRGSVEILRRWDSTSCQPVRYGQCWVFAAVACTVSRALGIPCRVITNYNSAHDTNSNLVIERYVDDKGQPVQKSRDMIWNYHCWVESWMTRPDLQPGYDGWQASDPTPQEKSEGVYCCGPIPLKAIKEGELTFKYDAPFVFAEVNADVLTYMRHKDGRVEKIIGSTYVGQQISTKSVGSDRREDITHLYKYPEGSSEERETFKKANHQNKLLQQGPGPTPGSGLRVKITVPAEMRKGCDFDVFVVVANNTPATKLCRLMFCSRAASYSGILGKDCGYKDLLNLQVASGEEKQVPLRLNYCKYGGNVMDDNLIRVTALLTDYSSKDMYLAVRNIVLDDPEIKIRILGEPKVNRKLAAEITLQNPLPDPLDNCCFSVEGANLTDGKTITEMLGSPVGPGQEAKVKVYFTPSRFGLRKLVVGFNSSKLGHVKGYRNVIIGK